MARNLNPKCKQCRRVGEKLFLRGERCFTQKCAMIKKPYIPGVHWKSRQRGLSEYGKQLQEKQKIKKIYGILERQFKKYVKSVNRQRGDKRENLMRMLETRLDNIVFRLGFAKSRPQARQLVSHRLVMVDRKIINIPSYQVRPNQVVALKDKIKKSALAEDLKIYLKNHQIPGWLNLDKQKFEGKIINLPTADDFGNLDHIGTILEYYSR